jgi:hypothetical protein
MTTIESFFVLTAPGAESSMSLRERLGVVRKQASAASPTPAPGW